MGPLHVAFTAYGETIPVGEPSGEWLGFRGDVLGPGPPQREWHGRTRLSQSHLPAEEALLQQRHRSPKVPALWGIAGTQVLDGGEHVSHRQQQQHHVAPAGRCSDDPAAVDLLF